MDNNSSENEELELKILEQLRQRALETQALNKILAAMEEKYPLEVKNDGPKNKK